MLTLVKKVRRGFINVMAGHSSVQLTTLRATCNDPTPAKQEDLQLLADKTFIPFVYSEIMCILWARLFGDHEQYLHVLKSAILLRFLITNGHIMVVTDARQHLEMLHTLLHYQNKINQGSLVRKEAEEIMKLLTDTDYLAQQRSKYESYPDRLIREAREKAAEQKGSAIVNRCFECDPSEDLINLNDEQR